MDNPTELKMPDASKGGEARARKLSPERRSEIVRQAVRMRWAKARGLKEVTPEVAGPDASRKQNCEVFCVYD